MDLPMQPTRLPRKKDVAIALLEQATVFVHIDPRAAEVFVPPWFKRQPQLVLQIGLNMPVPIPDLDVSDHGLSCTLSFNRSPFHCRIPWAAVFALVGESGRGMVWPDDVPPEVAAQAQKQAKPQLQAVAAPAPAVEEAPAAAPAPAAKKRTEKVAKPRTAKAAKASAKSEGKSEAKGAGKKARGAQKKAAPARPAAARPAPAPRPEPARRAPVAEAAPLPEKVATLKAAGASAKGSPSARKKRALPPYLRVVK
jgi:stringent starvation protein B